MSRKRYDESTVIGRLARLDRQAKTAYAAACAECLLPMFKQYANAIGDPGLTERLRMVVAVAWELASGGNADARSYQSEAEAMVPSEDGDWIAEMGYGQNAAAAAAYAIRTWLTDDPQEAAWAGRQVYELADYAALRNEEALGEKLGSAMTRVLPSEVVQKSLVVLGRLLGLAEQSPLILAEMRARTILESQTLTRAMPVAF